MRLLKDERSLADITQRKVLPAVIEAAFRVVELIYAVDVRVRPLHKLGSILRRRALRRLVDHFRLILLRRFFCFDLETRMPFLKLNKGAHYVDSGSENAHHLAQIWQVQRLFDA
jgi:hypothetical protein